MKGANNYGSKFKAQAAIAAAGGEKTLNELGKVYKVHPRVLCNWRKQLISQAYELFESKIARNDFKDEEIKNLYEQIGRLKVENDFLKKKSGLIG
jgi:transposase-like protein